MFSEIVGNVSTQDNRSYYALSTLDGMYSKRCVVIYPNIVLSDVVLINISC